MADKVDAQQVNLQTGNGNNNSNKIRKSPEFQIQTNNINNPGIITRERSFVRTSNPQNNANKRRSLAFNMNGINAPGQMRGSKPAMDIYRPPNMRNESNNKLNANAQEFTMSNLIAPPSSTVSAAVASAAAGVPTTTQTMLPPHTSVGDAHNSNAVSSTIIYPGGGGSGGIGGGGVKSGGSASLQQQMQFMAASNSAAMNRRQAGLSMGAIQLGGGGSGAGGGAGHRPILVTHSHPMQMGHLSHHVPLINSPSSGNILHQTNRVKFAAEPQRHHHHKGNNTHYSNSYQQQQHQQQLNAAALQQQQYANGGLIDVYGGITPLQRSKSLSSADALTRGIAGLGLALGNDITDIGQFKPEIQALIDTALEDPNSLNSRCLIELTQHFIKRAIEGRRYALPIARLCLAIIAKEQKETFLEALLNTCRQWYQEREKLLFDMQGMKSPSRVRLTAFMAFLTEMFCQLKRRQLQLRTQCEGASPPLVLLTLLSKCCEDCVRPHVVLSLSEIECFFYVLTCIGQDMELQLPQQLELLLGMVRDAFLVANDAPPAIRRTLLQLIELQASHWQLAGTSVLYYYPSK